MYTDINFKTKKELLQALAGGAKLTIHSPGIFPAPRDGEVSLEGPHYPKAHTWYARATMKDGVIVSAK